MKRLHFETVIMVIGSGVLGSIIGIPLGVLLHVTDKGGLMPKLATNAIVGVIVNAVRSTPFIILLVAIYPLTRLIVGTTIGTTATLVPLVIGVAPFIARLVETSLREVDRGLIEAAQSMGASDMQIILKVLIPEAMPGIVAAITIAIISLHARSDVDGCFDLGGFRASHSKRRRLVCTQSLQTLNRLLSEKSLGTSPRLNAISSLDCYSPVLLYREPQCVFL